MNYVLAVSGGVDSLVLLDSITNNRLTEIAPNYQLPTTNDKLVVAHFDHGIRTDSLTDEKFVRGVAGKYNLPYETERAELGLGASEEEARLARYNFLRRCCNKYKATLLTAHHQNDVVETMLINLIRGTNWRGLTPMSDQTSDPKPSKLPNQLLVTNNQTLTRRPLINTPKSDILAYATKYKLRWKEDSTNADTKYLRNYIRLVLLPKMVHKDPTAINKLLELNRKTIELKNKIATESQYYFTHHHPLTTPHTFQRYALIMLPSSVAKELIYQLLTNLDPTWHPSSQQLTRVLHFAKTALPGKTLEVSSGLRVQAEKSSLQFKNT